MKVKGFVLLTCLLCFSFVINNSIENNRNWIAINWVDKLDHDFSFKNKWSYPEGVYKNLFGQISCDGLCPPETDRMKDHEGRIIADSLEAFYQIVDTTHLSHSIKSEVKVYEYSGTNIIRFNKQPDNSIIGQTDCNASTHSSLNIKIKNDSVTAWVYFNSIRDLGTHQFPMKYGQIKIDKKQFEKGIIKAEFDMTFKNTINPDEKLFWKGLIYSKIEEQKTNVKTH